MMNEYRFGELPDRAPGGDVQSRVLGEGARVGRVRSSGHPLAPRSKAAWMENWPEHATSDPRVIRPWFPPGTAENLGLATGRGVFALDLDCHGVARDRGDGRSADVDGLGSLRVLEMEAGAGLPRTAEAMTGGGGRHLLFRVDPAYRIGNRTRWRAGIDIKGDDGMIVVEPSIHKDTGREYVWIRHPRGGIAEAPDWLVNLLVAEGLLTEAGTHGGDDLPASRCQAASSVSMHLPWRGEESLVDEMIEKFPIPERGQRNDQMVKAITRVLGCWPDPELARRVGRE